MRIEKSRFYRMAKEYFYPIPEYAMKKAETMLHPKDKKLFLKKFIGGEDYYEIRWTVSGASGGNCWGDEAEYFWIGDAEKPEMSKLIAFLNAHFPDFDFAKISSITKESSEEDVEWYGNYTVYSIHRVYFSDLYSLLKKEGCIKNG